MENTPNLMPEMSEKFDIIMKQLMLAKKEMGSSVKKDATNPFHKSKYASLGAHLDLCEPILDKHGLIMLQTVNGTNENAVLVATLCHAESGQWVKSYLPLPNPKGDSQGLGASLTYMRRYSISSMLGLNAEDDDGETAAGRGKHEDNRKEKKEAGVVQQSKIEPLKTSETVDNFQSPAQVQKLSPQQVEILKSLEKKLDNTCKNKINTWLNASYKTTVHADLPADCFAKFVSAYENAFKFMQNDKLEVAHA